MKDRLNKAPAREFRAAASRSHLEGGRGIGYREGEQGEGGDER